MDNYQKQPYGATAAIAMPVDLEESASRIRDGISAAEQELSQVHSAIDRLEKRLDTILTPVPPSTLSGNANKASQPSSHVMGRIELLNEGFQHATSRLRALTLRVEV